MEYVYLLQATEAQYQKMMKFLDVAIKQDGLEVIQDVVDIYNVLVSGQKIQVPTTEQAAPEVPVAEAVTPPDSVG
jgi:hypothetical protein